MSDKIYQNHHAGPIRHSINAQKLLESIELNRPFNDWFDYCRKKFKLESIHDYASMYDMKAHPFCICTDKTFVPAPDSNPNDVFITREVAILMAFDAETDAGRFVGQTLLNEFFSEIKAVHEKNIALRDGIDQKNDAIEQYRQQLVWQERMRRSEKLRDFTNHAVAFAEEFEILKDEGVFEGIDEGLFESSRAFSASVLEMEALSATE